MRGPNSQSSLRATSISSLLILIVLSIIVPNPAYTRSVRNSQNQQEEIRLSNHGIIEKKLNLKIQHIDDTNERKDDNLPEVLLNDEKSSSSVVQNGHEKRKIEVEAIGESLINSPSDERTKIREESLKVHQEGIRRFDAVVASEDHEKIGDEDNKFYDRTIGKPEIDTTVIKGIIVIDDPLEGDGIHEKLSDGNEEVKQNRKRSLDDPKSANLSADKTRQAVENSEKKDTSEKNDDSAKARQVPVLIPVGSSSLESSRELSKHAGESSSKLDAPELAEVSEIVQENMAKNRNIKIEKSSEETDKMEMVENGARIPELIQVHGARKEEIASEDDESLIDVKAIVPEMKKIIIHEDGLGEVEKNGDEEYARKSLLISDEEDRNEEQEEEEEDGRLVRSEDKKEEIEALLDDSTSLPNILRTNVSLKDLTAQALSLQRLIKNVTSLQRLRDEEAEILPEIPKFTENELLETLNMFSSLKQSHDDTEYSYLSKMDTSKLSEAQLKILRCTEALIAREERQTFSENIFECIRGLNILNCMRIFVWPIIADNIPESFSQNWPTLPIEVNVADWLPGNQRDKPKSSRLHSTTSVSSHQRRLITPELVVTNILRDALTANPPNANSAVPTYIDPSNETLSKLLTPGQLEILKMAETFLPESSRQEYSDRMYSCVRRFEYFSCIKYFAWPMVKQHFPELPEFPNYQSWYPSVTLHPGYPIVPYPNAEGIGQLPEVIEADATRTRTPRPEAVIVDILQNTLRQAPRITNFPTSYSAAGTSGGPAVLTPLSADQMAIFYTAEKLIPVPMRQEFISKTMNCIRDYDYLTCTKYSTWPAVRQLYPGLPEFPDFSSWIPTFAIPELPDFATYIPDFGSYFPTFPGFPGSQTTPKPEVQTTTTTTTTTPRPQPITERPPYQPQPSNPRPPYQPQTPTSQPPYEPQPTTSQPPYEPQPTTSQPSVEPQPIASQPPFAPQPQPTTYPPYQPTAQTTPKPFYQPQPIPTKPPYQVADSSNLWKDDHKLTEEPNAIENRIIQILSNIRLTVIARNSPQITPIIPANLAVLNTLTYNQMKILVLSKSVISPQVRGDVDARLVGCLQGGSDFLTCTRNVIWPTLQLYVKDMPLFPEEESKNSGLTDHYAAIIPAIHQPIVKSSVADVRQNFDFPQIDARSPIGGRIEAESEELQVERLGSIGQHGEKLSINSAPVISITETRFTPIFSDHPETVLLKILTTIQSSSKLSAENSQPLESSGYLESLDGYLNLEQKSIIQVTENLLPEAVKPNFIERISGCVKNSNFVVCSRDIVWPTLSQYYPRLPNFPNFYVDDSVEKKESGTLGSMKLNVPGAISETDVKTGQHGDAVVTITDTRFVPIFSEHPEELIMGILKNLQASTPNSQGAAKTTAKSVEFVSTFTDQQGNIITVAENLLPESIRQVFNRRMTECMKDNEFLDCTRDIAWPTIAQFFPRLPNFPNIESLPALAVENKPAEQSTPLLPPQLEPAGLDLAIPAKSALTPAENFVAVTPEEEVESRIESTLKQIPSTRNYLEPKLTYFSTKDPLIGSLVTERQAGVIRMCEDLLPNSAKPIFVVKMVECVRADVFPNCIRNIGWPTLRQYVPNIPEFPNFGNFESYFPQVPQEIPEIPQFPDYQLPQVPDFPGFGLPGQNYAYPFRAGQDKISQEAAYFDQGSLITEGQPGHLYLRGIQGLTPSVDPSSFAATRPGTSGYSSLVPGSSSQSAKLMIRNDLSEKIISTPASTERRRKRRSIGLEPIDNYQDIPSNDIDPLPLNVTESEFLEFLVNITKQSNQRTKDPEDYFVARLNSTIKEALTADQYAILKIVEDINSQTAKAGFMSRIVQCIRSLSFIRCMGIFVWPLISQNIPSIPGISILADLNPFGRSAETNNFQDIFGLTSEEFEKELLERKENVEEILMDWYRSVVEDKFDKDYGFMKIRGYGDGEIGISFNGFERTGRGAKLKDNKNLPSILTIISDLMEDMLDQRESRPESERKKEHNKRTKRRRDKTIHKRIILTDDYNNKVTMANGEDSRDLESTSNDDKIIAMFLDKIRSNSTTDNNEKGNEANNYLNVEDAYQAFELLFGTRLTVRMSERLGNLGKKNTPHLREDNSRKAHEIKEKHRENEKLDEKNEKKNIRSGLILRLPQIGEEFVSRKTTSGLIELGRKMKMEMTQIMPGISFIVSFFIQMALAHARAAASVAGMMSNMALGSAVMSMIRQSFFGPMTHPKVKYVYDNVAMGPGITWPQHHHR